MTLCIAVAEVRKNHHGTTGFEEEGFKFVVKVDAFFVSAQEQDEVGVDPDGFILDEYMLEAEEQVREDDIKELMKFCAEPDAPQINPPVGIAFNDALEAFAKAADAYAGRNLGICAVRFAEWIGICMDADRVQICYGQLEWEGKRCAVALMSEYDVFLPDPDNATPEPAAALR